MTVQSGAILAGRYRLTRLIAVGGMGAVWEAHDTTLGRDVAMKILKPELSGDDEFIDRFRTEARTTAGLNHPGIASVFDYGEVHDPTTGKPVAFLVMELVHGEPLNAVLKRVGRLNLTHTLDMLEQTGRALQAAHNQGLIHRDVKPGNILITPAGQVKITDFGIAKAADAVPVTQEGMVIGTAQYISPEQARGQNATSASDVYALCVVGFECLAGRRPFTADTAVAVAMQHIRDEIPELPADIPQEVRTLITTGLSKDPQDRYRSGGEFAAAVARVRAGLMPARPSGAQPVPDHNPAAGHTQVLSQTGMLAPQPATITPQARPNPATARRTPPPAPAAPRRKTSGVATGTIIGLLLLLIGLGVAFIVTQMMSSPTPVEPTTEPSTVTVSSTVTQTPSTTRTTSSPSTSSVAPTTSEVPEEPTTPELTTAPVQPTAAPTSDPLTDLLDSLLGGNGNGG